MRVNTAQEIAVAAISFRTHIRAGSLRAPTKKRMRASARWSRAYV